MLRQFPNLFRQFWAKYGSPQNMSQLLERAALNYASKEAVVCDEQRLTFSELHSQVTRLASGLSALGVSKGQWVGIMLPNCPEFVVSFLAIAKIGAVVAPVDIYYRQPELESMLRDAQIRALITSSEFLEVVEPALKSCPDVKHLILKEPEQKKYASLVGLWQREEEAERLRAGKSVPISPKDDLLYLYTSGTTGIPKGLLLSHAKVIAIGRAWRARFEITEDDKCYTLAPLFRSPALLSVLVAGLYYGITMVIPPTFRPHQVWQEVTSHKVSFFHACPFHFAVLAHLPALEPFNLPDPDPDPDLKLCYSSGNKIPPKVAQKFRQRFGIAIDERYGTSEVGGICRNGFPLRGVRIKLLDEQGNRITEQGGVGEIVVKTPFMMTKYYNLPDLSRQAFKNGWFHTGDLGKIDQEGRVKILWRKKRTFLIDGQLVYADEIERVLRSHAQVKEVRVVRDKRTYALKALVVLKEPCPQEALLEFCKSRLASYKIPSQIEIREELPRSWKAVIAGMEQAYPKWGEF